MNPWQDYTSHEIDVSKELDADFNFLKIHLIYHWVEQICRYGALPQYSAKRHEQTQKTNLKDCWNASTPSMNYRPRVSTFQHLILGVEIRERNLQPLAQRQENRAATWQVLPSDADRAAPLSSLSYAKREFKSPQNCHEWKHLDTMIINFGALHENTQDAKHQVAIFTGTQEVLSHMSCNMISIWDEQLHAMELCISDGIKLPAEGLEGERISLMCQCRRKPELP